MVPGQSYALWIVGPLGCGKTNMAAKLGDRFPYTIDQDASFEQLLIAERFPLDFRTHQPSDANRVSELRTLASKACWGELSEWRRKGLRFSIQTPGDKPHLLYDEVERNRRSGYVNLALLIECSLRNCQSQNRRRARILPSNLVQKSWRAFRKHMEDGVYKTIFSVDCSLVLRSKMVEEVINWLDGQ